MCCLALWRRMGRLQWLHFTMSGVSAKGRPVGKEDARVCGMRFMVGVVSFGSPLYRDIVSSCATKKKGMLL